VHGAVTKNISEKKILLPSALVELLTHNCDLLLSDLDKRITLCSSLQSLVVCDIAVCQCFIYDYVLLLIEIVLKFYSSSLKELENNQGANEEIVPLDNEDKETIHYVSGSVVRAFY